MLQCVLLTYHGCFICYKCKCVVIHDLKRQVELDGEDTEMWRDTYFGNFALNYVNVAILCNFAIYCYRRHQITLFAISTQERSVLIVI